MPAELTLEHLAVTGPIPPGLNGRYLKMGANPVPPDRRGITGSSATAWCTASPSGTAGRCGIAIAGSVRAWQPRRSAVPQRPGRAAGRIDTVNTNVVDFGGRAFALVEAGSFPSSCPRPWKSSATTRSTARSTARSPGTRIRTRSPASTTPSPMTAASGTPSATSSSRPAGKVVRDVPIAVEHGPCIHDCAFTARFVVVLDLPVTFSMRAVLGGHLFPFRWNPAHHARLGLLPRDGDAADIIWCDVEPCFVFHVANAFDDEDGRVILDVIAYATMFASARAGSTRWAGSSAGRSTLRRAASTAA